MLTQERAAVLTKILEADEARTQTFLSLEPEEAVKQINALGNDFTVDELCEYGEALQAHVAALNEKGELDADALDNVAGGFGILATIGLGIAACAAWDATKWIGGQIAKAVRR